MYCKRGATYWALLAIFFGGVAVSAGAIDRWAYVMQWLAIVAVSVLAAMVYGICHDQVTAHVCVEYFTIAHPKVIQSESPTLPALQTQLDQHGARTAHDWYHASVSSSVGSF